MTNTFSETACDSRWHWLCFALLALIVQTLTVSPALSHRVANEFSNTLQVNRFIAERSFIAKPLASHPPKSSNLHRGLVSLTVGESKKSRQKEGTS